MSTFVLKRSLSTLNVLSNGIKTYAGIKIIVPKLNTHVEYKLFQMSTLVLKDD